jgi:hypothetical protein
MGGTKITQGEVPVIETLRRGRRGSGGRPGSLALPGVTEAMAQMELH